MLKPRDLPWGKVLFLIISAIVSFDLVIRGNSGHFDIFRNSARILWSKHNPYGILYPSAYYLYSPFCGMSVFSLFAWLPYKLDLFLYISLSIAVLFFSLITLCKNFPQKNKTWEEFFFAFIAFEMIGSILNAKLEILMTGILIWGSVKVIKSPRNLLAPVLLAAICNWKFQPLPAVGLLLLGLLLYKKCIRPSLVFILSFALFFILPGFYLGFKKLFVFQDTWKTSLMNFMLGGENNWLGFQHLFQSLRSVFNFSISYQQAMMVNLVIALFLVLLWAIIIKSKKIDSQDLLLWPLSAGAFFATTLSPLSQSAAFILVAPLLYSSMLEVYEHRNNKIIFILLAISVYFLVGSYSDLTPKFIREVFKIYSVKAISVSFLFILYTILHYRRKDFRSY